ncbi:MAG: exodeoxyribonuclease VII large subunit [Eubacterium sp.]|nr:exodeoxyribonuclease VII large subunit [Eubacterium sp.]
MPPYPKSIGIVTAVTGAAIEDIKTIAARRNPYVQLYLYPAKVQGEGAALSIAGGIRYFDSFGVDIIIIGRGGGSMEDLWAFNERIVADAIYHADTPVISGTGHEIDMTIADYCADLRAPTPSAACELAIPDVFSILQLMDRYQDSLELKLRHRLEGLHRQLDVYEKLLKVNHPGSRLDRQRTQTNIYRDRLNSLMEGHRLRASHRIDSYGERLTALSPSVRLRGGYVFAQKMDDTPVSSVRQLGEKEVFTLIFRDGRAEVENKRIMIEEEN